MAATVRQLLQAKGGSVVTVSPQATVFEALEAMAKHDIGALLVTDESGLRGIFSERDYARKIVLMGRFSRDTKVEEVMSTDLVTIAPEATVAECMNLMTHHRIRHLPVLDKGVLVGVISIGDVVKAIMSQQELMISELESYITGSR
ncbi:CBS domain-containing protein [Meiothermus granaticius]|uniref:Hypoxic response protein 1 n=1 Tax=Meiothermus granaticius NBRC 107808 TaxID=1227551 RepID=A0A399F639_9DEIN|nr:CBS domain-containing protein [Meiothermus granaticius]MCL6526242.1 CBS domain-containing protein [Thermaceae bacterium]RIH91195.1 Hypoxic response protein 1 [Meiothermus granaticius NBRC 107808]GEM87482.1 inosine-5-monophosphate dehydrogenase [Meiothermus granaticius NBRC 107808]